MKKIILMLVLILGIAGEARAQLGQRISTVQNSLGQPITGATVSVCAYNAGSYGFINGAWTYTGPIPCTPLVPIFADPAGANTISPPLLTTGIGNYTYWISSSNYTECVTGGQITGACYAVQVGGIGGGGGGSPASPAGSVQFANASVGGFASVTGLQVDSITSPTKLFNPLALIDPNINGDVVVDGTVYAATNAGIQAAVNATPAGGTLYIPNGTYLLTGTGTEEILITQSINIKCAGWGTLLEVGPSVPNTTDVFHIKIPAGITLSGIQIKDCAITNTIGGGASNVGRYGFNIDAGNSALAAVAFMKITHNLVTGIGGNYSIAVTNSSNSTNGAIYLSTIEDNELSNGGILMAKTGDSINVQRNQITYFNSNATSSGVDLDSSPGASHTVIDHNNITTKGGCLVVHGAIQPKFQYNQCEQVIASTETNSAMIDLQGDDFSIDSADISGNNLNTNGFAVRNIRISFATNTNIANNSMNETATTGIGIAIVNSAATNTNIGPNNYTNVVTGAITVSDAGTHTQFSMSPASGHPSGQFFAPTDNDVAISVIRNSATQSAVLFTAQDNSGNNLFFITPKGDASWLEHTGGIFTQAGRDGCGADSVSHTLQCSFNGGTPGTVGLLNLAQTWSLTQTFTVAPTITSLAGGGVQCMQINNSGVVGLSGATCGGGGGGSSIFTQWQFGSNAALSSTGLYIQLTAPAMFNLTQTGAGTIGNPYIDTFAFASQAGGTVLNNATGGSAVPTFTAAEVLGIAASSAGTLALCNGGASGACVTQQVLTATAAYNFNLPATAGTPGQLVTSQGGGSNPMTYTSPTITIQGVACTLGVSCTPLTIQTNTVNNTLQSTLNILSSSTNSVGLTLTQTNTSAGNVKGEIAGLLNSLGGGTGLSSPAAHCYLITEGINPFGTNCSPIVNGFYVCGFNVFAAVQVDPTCTLQGVAIVANSGASTTLTSAANVTLQQFTSGSAQTVTGPPLASNITFDMLVTGAGGVTYTASASTCNGNATCLVPGGWFAQEFTDNSKTIMAILAGQGAFPNTTANQALTFTAATGVIGTIGNLAVGPGVSVNGDAACWNGTTGLLLSDCGAAGANTVTSAGTQTSGAIAIGGGTKTLGAPLAATGNDYIVIASGAGVWTQTQVNAGADCGDASHAIKFTAATQTFACQAITGSAAAGGNANTIQWNNATALGGIVQWTTNGTTTITGSATAVLDMSAGAPVSALKLPTVAGAIPTADGFIGVNSTIHALVWGSNGTTIVTAAAGTSTTASTTCTNQFVRAISSVAAPTCATVSLTADVSGILPVANGGLNTGTPGFAALTDGATVTWAIGSALIDSASLTFTVHSGSRTLNITGPVDGGQYTLVVIQDGTGGEGLTLGSGCTWKIIGGGGGAITPSTGANAQDVLAFTYRASNTSCYANFGKNYN